MKSFRHRRRWSGTRLSVAASDQDQWRERHAPQLECACRVSTAHPSMSTALCRESLTVYAESLAPVALAALLLTVAVTVHAGGVCEAHVH